MRKIFLITICIILITGVVILYKTKQDDRPSYLVDTHQEYDLDLDNKNELLYFHTKEVKFGNWTTEVFVNNSVKPVLIVSGLLKDYRVYDIAENIRILELEISAGGKLVNSLLYKYHEGFLVRVPIAIDSNSQLWDVWSSGGAEFKDLDDDGVLEMLVYHRNYPPKANRRVEAYRFEDNIFQKYKEYKEATEEIYL